MLSVENEKRKDRIDREKRWGEKRKEKKISSRNCLYLEQMKLSHSIELTC